MPETKIATPFSIELIYPENWLYQNEPCDQGQEIVSFESPSGSFAIFARYPNDVDPAALLDEVSESFAKEYDEVETEDLDIEIGEDSYGIDIRFFYLDLMIHVRAIAFEAGEFVYMLKSQVVDGVSEHDSQVLEALRLQMLKGLGLEE